MLIRLDINYQTTTKRDMIFKPKFFHQLNTPDWIPTRSRLGGRWLLLHCSKEANAFGRGSKKYCKLYIRST